MVASRKSRDILYVGVDGGGSKCRASIFDADNRLLGTGVSGPANPLHGYAQTIDSIVRSAALAVAEAGLPAETLGELVAGVGLAGVNMPRLYNEMLAWAHPFKQMFLTTDQHSACLGAHRGGDGAVIIAGTGSVGYAWTGGRKVIVGGHGFPHGDKGSGAWLGMEAIKYVLMVMDGLAENSMLSREVQKALGTDDPYDVIEMMAGKPSSQYARLAVPVVECAEANCPVAASIMRDGADYISDLADKLMESRPPRLAMIGGLAPRLKPWLKPHVAEKMSDPLDPPELGCVYFAQQSLAALADGDAKVAEESDSKALFG
ncbi:BadF/BadG/BcrA/BcrD ATPase family protein [Microbulbifer bruguierae]|uniref:BadF/BadG/BcrA/BcrD ATPase family protein n=1 Tax=Microbulbifer bruguierae TaxID=3029061 RepID=A0ABY8NBX6_9GAMM|nr:BadF/BadG/BcrA/BcrD ATPase family protein [Microbulbifer bruguierae]WGL16425.1 BadF/BadG/BcrA/BcrD ATPase family protein [Microbulbifer bruguierae]